MSLNSRIVSATGVGGAALFIVLAGNLDEMVAGVGGIPALFEAFADIMPSGSSAVGLAFAVSIASWQAALRYLHPDKAGKPADFAAETLAIVSSICVTVGMAWGSDAKTLLVAVALGFIAGNAGPWVAKGVRSAWVAFTKAPAP